MCGMFSRPVKSRLWQLLQRLLVISARQVPPALSWGFCQDRHHEEVIWVKLVETCSGTSRPADGCYRLKPAVRPEIPAKSGILGPVQNSHSRRFFCSVLLGKA